MPVTNIASAVRANMSTKVQQQPKQQAVRTARPATSKSRITDNYAMELNNMCAANHYQCVQACGPSPAAACLQQCAMTADICTFSPP
jgi:hypothetical protein